MLLGYSRGLISGCTIKRTCAQNVLFVAPSGCGPCTQREQCRCYSEQNQGAAAIFAKNLADPHEACETMKRAIDSPKGGPLYSQRIDTVEPVFGNIRHNKGLRRFTLRGKQKVCTQWDLYCLVHNIEKLEHYGYC